MGSTIEEIEEPVKHKTTSKAVKTESKPAAVPKADAKPAQAQKRKADAIESPAAKAAPSAADTSVDGLSKAERKKLAKKAKTEGEAKKEAPKPAAPKPQQGQKVRK
jgi:FK506-binding nuclear protein